MNSGGSRCASGRRPVLQGVVRPTPDPAYKAAMTTTFGFDPSTRELHGPAGRVPVQPLVLRLAAALLEVPGEVVPYSAITVALWTPPAVPPARTVVSIRTCARKLRSALRCVGAEERLKTLVGAGLRITLPGSAQRGGDPALAEQNLTFDPATVTVRYGRREIDLPPQAVTIMRTLLTGDGLATRAQLLAALYGARQPPATAEYVLRVSLSALRRKLRAAGVPVTIAPVYGVGYRLRAEEPPMGGS